MKEIDMIEYGWLSLCYLVIPISTMKFSAAKSLVTTYNLIR